MAHARAENLSYGIRWITSVCFKGERHRSNPADTVSQEGMAENEGSPSSYPQDGLTTFDTLLSQT